MHPEVAAILSAQHRQELLDQAERWRLLACARESTPNAWQTWVGAHLPRPSRAIARPAC
jgi:hypothetical protein